MPIYIDESKKIFHLTDEKRFSLVLQAVEEPDGMLTLMNTYYGAPVYSADFDYLNEYNRNGASFDGFAQLNPNAYPSNCRGDFRIPAFTAVGSDGTGHTSLTYKKYEVIKGKPALNGLPMVYTESESEAETLIVTLEDSLRKLYINLRYTVLENLHALTQSVEFVNFSDANIIIRNPASCSVTLRGEYDFVHLHGGWAKERAVERIPAMHGVREINSSRGASGHAHNPFIAMAEKDTTEFSGNCYGFCLVYSGSHAMKVEENEFGTTRFVGGINSCEWILKPAETFETPEMILSYSPEGFNGMSQIIHDVIRTRVCRGKFRDMPRPVLVNNWEGTYFGFNEEKLLAIAKKGAEIGAELFVLDDGWFGKRNDDHSSLGDWFVNTEKLPNGIKGLAEKINALGLKFGLWFEPEMISPVSELYTAHEDWCLHVPGRFRNEQRNQLILDYSRKDVQDYIIDVLSERLTESNIEYVKWDMNRNFSEVGSACLSPEEQGMVSHKYMLGLYRVMETLVTRFPNVLFEGCSGGGGRFDAGILYYMPQIWTSDDSDAVERLFIQYGTSFAYPPSAMGAHVSAVPNHQLGRMTSLEMRGAVALSGNFGYELDLTQLPDDEIEVMKQQVARVKSLRHLTNKGRFTRLVSPFEGNIAAWQFSDTSNDELLVCAFRRYNKPNPANVYIKVRDIDEKAWYVTDDGTRYHGSTLKNVGFIPSFMYMSGDDASQIMHLTKEK